MKGWLFLACVLGSFVEAWPATVLERAIDVSLENERVFHTTSMLVELTRPGDLEAWERFHINLSDNVELVSAKFEVLGLDQKVLRTVSRREHERIESVGFGVYTSNWVSVVPLGRMSVGQRIRIHYKTVTRPYYPATQLSLMLPEPQSELRVVFRGDPEGLRWHISGITDRFEVTRRPGGLELFARDVPEYESLELAPAAHSIVPHLWVAWSREGSWRDVGMWYEELTARLPRNDESVAGLASSLAETMVSPPQRVHHIAEHVRKKVRYEAVEVGVGGYVPTPAKEVASRAWGDCKDKAELLTEMLAAVGIPSHLVLTYLGLDSVVDPEFPSPYQFNHVIVGIPVSALGDTAHGSIAEDLLFLDPTWEDGGLSWLAPHDRGRNVLVVDGERSRLVYIPDLPDADTQHLTIEGRLRPDGALEGRLRIELHGVSAIPWLDVIGEGAEAERDDLARRWIGSILTGAQLFSIELQRLQGDAPAVEVRAALIHPRIGRGDPTRRAIRAPVLDLFPDTRLLDGRRQPVTLRAGIRRTTWEIELPAASCPVRPSESVIENALGRIATTVLHEPGALTIRQESRLDRSWIAAGDFDRLRELAVAESRASRRQVRARCPEATTRR